jgi:peptidoglycan/xylan/chitin deacetylase (PgdA/CDA1 family)
LRAMRAAGMEIGCHGTRHLDLTGIGEAAATREVNRCVAVLTHYLARPTTYAYAAGRWNAVTLGLMRESHMKAALTELPGVVTSLTTPYALPRRRIDRTTGLASFAALATP